MGKVLFIISLKYPLMNAINIKLNELKEKRADIILDGNKNDYEELAKRLQDTGVFEKVFLVNPEGFEGIKTYLKKHDQQKSILKALNGTIKNINLKRELKQNKEKFINSCIVNDLEINLMDYNELYVASESRVSWACTDVLVKRKLISKIHLIEEGSRDYGYTEVMLQRRDRYRKIQVVVHLYDTDLVAYDKDMFNIEFVNIKKIQLNDSSLVGVLNHIFNYEKHDSSYDEKIIFFEQVAEPMPSYLKKSSGIMRLLLHNAYKKHLREDKIFQEKSMVIRYILDLLKAKKMKNKFLLKLHPRTIRGILPECSNSIMGDKNNIHSIPWEVYCVNETFKNNIWIAINSSSIVNRIICFENQEDIKYIMLNGCKEITNSEFTPLEVFYRKIQEKYGEMLLLPKSIKELDSII